MVAHKIAFYIITCGISLAIWSCVDVPSQPSLPPVYHSLVRVIDVATDAPASSAVTMDNAALGNLAFTDVLNYKDVYSGDRLFSFQSTNQRVSLGSNRQHTVLVIPLNASKRFLNLDEGYTFRNNFFGGSSNAQVKFIHVGQGSFPTISFMDGDKAGPELKSSVPYISAEQYTDVPAGSHTVVAVSNGGYSASIDGSQGAPPNSSLSTGTGDVYLNLSTNEFTYTIDTKIDVQDSFFFAAHFHFGGAGVAGPVEIPIDISGQMITFPDDTLRGSNAVPAHNEITATATTKFTLFRDSLAYAITALTDSTVMTFTSSAFHNAAAGSVGPIVNTISAVPSGDTLITGSWSKNDVPPLTPALIEQLLTGKIYVSFQTLDSSLAPGEIRAQLVPSQLSTNQFTGTMTFSDSVTSVLADSLNVGHMYINFHNQTSPNGRIRGQLTPDPNDGGQAGIASYPATMFEAGHMYTLVATGAYQTLGLHLFSDRQLGLAKTGIIKQSSQSSFETKSK